MNRTPRLLAAVALGVLAVAALLGGRPSPAAGSGRDEGGPAGRFSRVVFLSHVNDPATTPVFPGDPEFTLTTVSTVAEDGFYLQKIEEGEHTGTHYSAPCHFHEDERCADQLAARDFVRPAVVVDVRRQAAARWLIRHRQLGALGTDTFGPDPGTDPEFRVTSLVLHGHRLTLENLAGLDRMPPNGAWLAVGGPRNRAGSGAPSTILGLVP